VARARRPPGADRSASHAPDRRPAIRPGCTAPGIGPQVVELAFTLAVSDQHVSPCVIRTEGGDTVRPMRSHVFDQEAVAPGSGRVEQQREQAETLHLGGRGAGCVREGGCEVDGSRRGLSSLRAAGTKASHRTTRGTAVLSSYGTSFESHRCSPHSTPLSEVKTTIVFWRRPVSFSTSTMSPTSRSTARSERICRIRATSISRRRSASSHGWSRIYRGLSSTSRSL